MINILYLPSPPPPCFRPLPRPPPSEPDPVTSRVRSGDVIGCVIAAGADQLGPGGTAV